MCPVPAISIPMIQAANFLFSEINFFATAAPATKVGALPQLEQNLEFNSISAPQEVQ
jgi:hypothetical protein